MLFDANACLGPYGLRQLRHNSAAGLLALMDRKGISRALVSSAAAIMYKDCQRANEELARELASDSRPALVPCAVLNPSYAGWERDLETCVRDLGMRALKLYPPWHNYTLDDGCCDAIVTAATELGAPVCIAMRAVDSRQLGWLFDVPDVDPAAVARLAQRHPRARFIVLDGIFLHQTALGRDAASLPPNYWLEISRMEVFIWPEIPTLLETLGPERLVFGTGAPFKYVDPVLLKMRLLEAPEEAKALIRGRNIEGLLG